MMMQRESRRSKPRFAPSATRAALLVALSFASACTTSAIRPEYESTYRAELPKLVDCNEDGTRCETACVSLENYLDTMIELEARCIALGGTGTDCAVSY